LAKLSSLGKFFVNRSNQGNSRRFLDTISEHLSLDVSSRCLEIGGGRGFLSYLVYDRFRPARVLVTDYDPSQVEAAKRLFESRLGAIPPSIEFRTADALDLPFEKETFDAVFGMVVLHHVERRDWQFRNIPKALDQIRRVLKPGGCFCYTELFSKNRIQTYLTKIGFEKIFAKRKYLITDSCIYRKERASPGEHTVNRT
jgi:ubiquinone/menaquinone biosynthesis C-methylase UbiE